ncbi:MAG: 2-hydroxyacyl-CoA dehydratase family protein [Dehalococcoidia bacterium]|jgi:benzoyl-CoA reductase subunit C|nr:2-hydroxyacyl-CoA dehydratase family protein [Dehalococcoidia bacterium]
MLEKFCEVNNTFPKTTHILEHKHQGKKVFGWLCTYVPEEIIHAAGALPIRITGYSKEMELEDGTAYLYINSCSFSRSCLQLGLKGEYDFLDGVAGGSTCDGARRLFDLWRNYIDTPFYHVLTVPRKYTQSAHDLYHSQVLQFKVHLEEFMGIQITDESLYQSIGVYNESRALLKRLYELRKLENPPITGTETMEVLNACFRMPKELFNEWLRNLLDELQGSDNASKSRARLMLVGSAITNPELIGSIEELGGLIVTDELCTGTRYWSDPVVLDKNSTPVEAISRRYLNNFPCARMFPSDERFNRILDLARDFRVDGVISQIIRYCVPYAHDLPLLTEKLKDNGIPTLALDVEYGTSGSGQIRTRVQAFLEMLEEKRR